MNTEKELAVRWAFYPIIIAFFVCVTAASCLVSTFPTASYCLFGGAGVALLTQLFVALGVTKHKSDVKVNGFKQWATAYIAFFVAIAVTICLPAVGVMFIVDAICRRQLARQSDK